MNNKVHSKNKMIMNKARRYVILLIMIYPGLFYTQAQNYVIDNRCLSGDYSIIRKGEKEPNNFWLARYGLIDKSGKIVIQPIYRNVYCLENGIAIVIDENKKWGGYNEKGELIIPLEYDAISLFTNYNSETIAEKKGLFGVINNKGRILVPFIYDDMEWYSKEILSVVKDDVTYCINLQNQKVKCPE